MAGYIEPQVSSDLATLAANPSALSGQGGSGISFKAKLWLKRGKAIIGPTAGSGAEFPALPSANRTAIINEATFLGTTNTGN